MSNVDIPFEHSFAETLEGLYVDHAPQGFRSPAVLELNDALIRRLGLPALPAPDAARLFSGTEVPPGARPVAQAYAGHQFGHLSPQLGDGRAVLLGEFVDRDGARFDLQLKGSGPTRFSRGGDGKATLGPVLRELLVSEAMAHLGISTSRVLAVVATGERVRRETLLPGAVLARVAASHLRVGTLEYLAIRDDEPRLRSLVRYALERHYPEAGAENPSFALAGEVAKAQARLIASWMHVGFIHGVMNTDNVTLSGETIDYGPCAFLDVYDPETAFSSIDRHGRYAYGNQPEIGAWNMQRLADALEPLVSDDEAVELREHVAGEYREAFNSAYLSGLREKIGIVDEAPEDLALMGELLDWMAMSGQDFTQTFRRLAQWLRASPDAREPELSADEAFRAWAERWRDRLGDRSPTAVAARMDAVNPIYIARNHLVEEALEAAHTGDMAPFRALADVLSRPFEPQTGRERYAEPAPKEFGPYRTFCGT